MENKEIISISNLLEFAKLKAGLWSRIRLSWDGDSLLENPNQPHPKTWPRESPIVGDFMESARHQTQDIATSLMMQTMENKEKQRQQLRLIRG